MNNLAVAYQAARPVRRGHPAAANESSRDPPGEARPRASRDAQEPEQPGRWPTGSPGRAAEAIPLFEHVLAIRRATLGPEHPDTLTAMNNLAVAYRWPAAHAEALPLHEQDLEHRGRPSAPSTPTR